MTQETSPEAHIEESINFTTLHIAFTSNNYPDSNICIANLETNLYKRFKDDYKKTLGSAETNQLPENLYSPECYVVFGSNDFCFLSLIDDLEFAQKNFSSEEFEDPFTSTQTFTGIPLHLKNENNDFKINKGDKSFFGVINLKIKNGFLIGNGEELLDPIIDKLKNLISETTDIVLGDSIIIQSFSWFEVTVVVFSNKISEIQQLIRKFRQLTFVDIFKDEVEEIKTEIINNSIYSLVSEFNNPDKKEKINKTIKDKGIFSDTQTTLGIRKEHLEKIIKFNEIIQDNNNVPLQINVQIKPSNIKFFRHLLDDDAKKFKYFISGKYDFTTGVMENGGLEFFKKLYEKLNEDDNKLHKIIRKLQTTILLEPDDIKESNPTGENVSISEIISNLKFERSRFVDMSKHLKNLKISRQIRKKMLKLYENFNEIITDAILFIYFVDTRQYLEDLLDVIEADYNKYENGLNLEVLALEKKYQDIIGVFDMAYYDRTVNSSRIENFNNYDIDYNSSIEQMLSIYNTIYTAFGNLFYSKKNKGKILNYNNNNTVSQGHFVNFFIYHLVTPEFTYVTFLKEMLNSYTSQNDNQIREFTTEIDKIQKIVNSSYELKKHIGEKIEDEEFDLYQYYVLDYLRVLMFFETYEFFEFWFWEFNFQNQRLFCTDGSISKDQLKKEMRRLFFLAKITNRKGYDLRKIECPLPEIHNYWIRYQSEIIDWVDDHCGELIAKIKNTCKEHWKDLEQIKKEGLEYNSDKLDNLVFQEIEHQKKYLDSVYHLFKDNKIKYLRRNWEDGKVMTEVFLERSEEYPYYVDQFGGIFYDNQKMKNEHHIIRTKEYKRIWNVSLIMKKKLIEMYKEKYEKEKMRIGFEKQ